MKAILCSEEPGTNLVACLVQSSLEKSIIGELNFDVDINKLVGKTIKIISQPAPGELLIEIIEDETTS